MVIYILVFIFLLIPLFLYRRQQRNESNMPYYIAEFLILTCLMGFRYRVGGDSIRYEGYYISQPGLSDLLSYDEWNFNTYQPLWNLLSSFCKSISDEFWVVQLLQSIIVNGIIFYSANRYCRYRYSFVIIYYLSQYLYFNCEIMREAIAISVFLLSFKYLVSHQYWKYYIYCFAAFMFHASAIILFILPFFYPLVSNSRGLRLYLTLVIIAVCMLISSGVVLHYLTAYLFPNNSPLVERLFNIGESSGLNMFGIISKIIFIVPVIITQYCLTRSKSQSSDAANFILSMYLLFAFVGLFFVPLNRFENYFIIFFLILFTNFICSARYKRRFTSLLPLSIIIYCVSVFCWYNTKVILMYNSSHTFRRYQRFIPYHSIIDREEDSEREWAVVMEGI